MNRMQPHPHHHHARPRHQQHTQQQQQQDAIRLQHLTAYTKRMLHDYPNVIARDCKSSNYPRIKHGPKTWKYLQQVYRQEAHRLKRQDFGVAWSMRHTGMQIPFHVKDDGPRGRSVYAAIDVPQGTRIWNPSKLATFEHPLELVNFLQRLPHDLQCDVLLWAYPDAEHEHVGLALDEGTFVNHADDSDDLKKNMDSSGHALRDIQAGEEILEDYTEFIGVDTLEWFNILRSLAWEEEIEENGSSDIQSGYVQAGVPLLEGHEAVLEQGDHGSAYDYSAFVPLQDKDATSSTTRSMLVTFALLVGAFCLWRHYSCRLIRKQQKKDAKACQ